MTAVQENVAGDSPVKGSDEINILQSTSTAPPDEMDAATSTTTRTSRTASDTSDLLPEQHTGTSKSSSSSSTLFRKMKADNLQNGKHKQMTALLDGSMGRQLCEEFKLPTDDFWFPKIWSAAALVKPEFHTAVVEAHKSYIEAGATLITTNSFGTQPTFYPRAFGEDEWESRMLADAELSSKLAVQARNEANSTNDVKIIGSLPSLFESHRPDIFLKNVEEKGEEFVVHYYHKIAEALLRGGADAILFETINCWEEAALGLEGISRLPQEMQPEIIVALEGAFRNLNLKPNPHLSAHAFRALLPRFALFDTLPEHLATAVSLSPEEHATAFEEKKGNLLDPKTAVICHKAEPAKLQVSCFGFNCAPPEEILDSLRAVRNDSVLHEIVTVSGLELCAYANVNDRKEAHDNGFEVRKDRASAIKKRTDLAREISPAENGAATDDKENPPKKHYAYDGYVDLVCEMVDAGATIVGGCCGCGPEGIHALGHRFF